MNKIAVLGLGKSLALYDGQYSSTIGVNDIWRHVQTDYLVCLDKPERFSADRLAVIEASRPQRFYSQIQEWATRPDYWQIALQTDYPNYVCQLDLPTIPKSLCSPFVACAIAFKLHAAKEIHLFGVDFIDHPHLHDESVVKLTKHFTNLRAALLAKGCKLQVHGDGALRVLNNL